MCLLRCTLMSKFSSQENLCLQFLGSQGTLIPWNLTRFPTYLIKPRRHTVAIACFCIRASEWDDAQGPTSDFFTVIEGSLEVKLPTIWTDEKQSRAEAERRERLEERRVEEKESEERRCRCAKR